MWNAHNIGLGIKHHFKFCGNLKFENDGKFRSMYSSLHAGTIELNLSAIYHPHIETLRKSGELSSRKYRNLQIQPRNLKGIRAFDQPKLKCVMHLWQVVSTLHNLCATFVRFMKVAQSCSIAKIKSNNDLFCVFFIYLFSFRWCRCRLRSLHLFLLRIRRPHNIKCLRANELIMLFNVGHSKMMVILFMFTTTI